MEQLKELKKEVTSMREYAKGVEPVMAAVMMLMDHRTKKEVLDYLDAVVIKLNEVADMIDRLPNDSSESSEKHSDECYLTFSKHEALMWLAGLQKSHYQIGQVLQELLEEVFAEKLDEWLIDYLVESRETLDCFLDDAKAGLGLPAYYFFNDPPEVSTNGEK